MYKIYIQVTQPCQGAWSGHIPSPAEVSCGVSMQQEHRPEGEQQNDKLLTNCEAQHRRADTGGDGKAKCCLNHPAHH